MNMKELLLEILNELRANRQPQLWGINELCAYFRKGKTTVQEKIVSCPDFPKPFRVNNTDPVYHPDEVMNWAKRKRG